MKRWICLLLTAALICLPLTACNEEKMQLPLIGVCVPENSIIDTARLTEHLQNKGYAVSVFTEKNDQNGQLQTIGTLFSEGFALLIVEPLILSAATEIMESPQRNGTPVLFVHCYGTAPEAKENTSFLFLDPTELGRTQAQAVSQLPDGGDINGDGTVTYAIMAGPQDDEQTLKQIEAIKESLTTAYFLETRHRSDTPDAAEGVCSGLLSTYGRDLEVLICTDSSLTETAVGTIANEGRIPGEDLYVIGADDSPALTQLLENGSLNAAAAPDWCDLIVTVSTAMLSGGEYESEYTYTYKILP